MINRGCYPADERWSAKPCAPAESGQTSAEENSKTKAGVFFLLLCNDTLPIRRDTILVTVVVNAAQLRASTGSSEFLPGTKPGVVMS